MSISIDKRQKEFFVLTLLAITGVYGVFASIDLFFFVIFYELASIPMYFLVGIWGSDKLGSGRPIYKEQAATKLLIYLQLGAGGPGAAGHSRPLFRYRRSHLRFPGNCKR
jgi:NADH-quinone oxidoreductase subunit M